MIAGIIGYSVYFTSLKKHLIIYSIRTIITRAGAAERAALFSGTTYAGNFILSGIR